MEEENYINNQPGSQAKKRFLWTRERENLKDFE
jgi:hypothetical protein